ncbi:MAG: hypothetical protein HQL35_04825 [Alphaproteobacteria bacterium]|nr:hypothetical protein [Alphaproteobacteria bacterium]
MTMKTLTAAVLDLTVLCGHYFPPHRKTDMGRSFLAATRAIRAAALRVQFGQPDAEPRNLLRLALEQCSDHGIPAQDIADIVNEHQRGNPGHAQIAAGGVR